jgi:small subunit ribosomal protein S8
MSMQDPISDLLTRIRNGQMAKKSVVQVSASVKKEAVLRVLSEEGYLSYEKVESEKGMPLLSIALKYFNGQPVIKMIKRVSRPGLRNYKSREDLPKVLGGLGVAIISTSKGLMTDKKARQLGQGGEVVCLVA